MPTPGLHRQGISSPITSGHPVLQWYIPLLHVPIAARPPLNIQLWWDSSHQGIFLMFSDLLLLSEKYNSIMWEVNTTLAVISKGNRKVYTLYGSKYKEFKTKDKMKARLGCKFILLVFWSNSLSRLMSFIFIDKVSRGNEQFHHLLANFTFV